MGWKDTFLQGAPEHPGGGTVEIVTPTDVHWAALPDREEAGSPNVIGAVAMAAAAETLMAAGIEQPRATRGVSHRYALERLREVIGLTLYGVGDASPLDDRVGVIAFNVGSMPHALVAAVLGYEAGIGVRSGCFCAQLYVAHLLGRAAGRPDRWEARHLAEQRAERPGMVRLSLGVYNTRGDVDVLVDDVGAHRTTTTFAGTTAGRRAAATTSRPVTKRRSPVTSRWRPWMVSVGKGPQPDALQDGVNRFRVSIRAVSRSDATRLGPRLLALEFFEEPARSARGRAGGHWPRAIRFTQFFEFR